MNFEIKHLAAMRMAAGFLLPDGPGQRLRASARLSNAARLVQHR